MGAIAPAFTVQMNRLRGLKFAPADLTTHWEALRDMDPDVLAAAVTKAQNASDEFPSPKMLKAYAEQVRPRVVSLPPEEDRSTPAPLVTHETPSGRVLKFNREWSYYCEDCSDSGWATFWCGGNLADGEQWPGRDRRPWIEMDRLCERGKKHGAHEWTAECSCALTNPDVIRRRERERAVKSRGEE